MTVDELNKEIERCDREIAAMMAQSNVPAWLTTLGIEDWQMERIFLVKELEQMQRPDYTREAVGRQLNAMGCEFFEIAWQRDEFTRRKWDADMTVASIPALKALNAQGNHIYISPYGEHNLSMVDDVKPERLQQMARNGYQPCAVVETSPGNLQCWLNHGKVLDAQHSTAAARYLAHPDRFNGDPNSADWRHLGRLAGFTNRKPKYLNEQTGHYPFVKLRHAEPIVYDRAEEVLWAVDKQVEHAKHMAEIRSQMQPQFTPRNMKTIADFRGDPRYGRDKHREDAAFALYAASHGMSSQAIAAQLWGRRDELIAKKGGERGAEQYVNGTIRKAMLGMGMSR